MRPLQFHQGGVQKVKFIEKVKGKLGDNFKITPA